MIAFYPYCAKENLCDKWPMSCGLVASVTRGHPHKEKARQLPDPLIVSKLSETAFGVSTDSVQA
jgi:hypothetical protein